VVGYHNDAWSFDKSAFKEHSGSVCVTFPKKPKRICANCNEPVERHDKWHFRDDGRIEHWDCNNKEKYNKEKYM
jgi:hypothetical protein